MECRRSPKRDLPLPCGSERASRYKQVNAVTITALRSRITKIQWQLNRGLRTLRPGRSPRCVGRLPGEISGICVGFSDFTSRGVRRRQSVPSRLAFLFPALNLGIWNFFRISDLGFRISFLEYGEEPLASANSRVLVILLLLLPVPLLAQEGLRAGMDAPDFKLPSVSGKTVTLREFQQKSIVIVHFWKSK